MTAPQTLPECFPHDPERAADERARWLAVYGAAYVQLAGRPAHDIAEVIAAAERVADQEAIARAAWEAEQVRKLDTEEG